MLPWELLDETTVPGDGSLMRLYRRGGEFSIKTGHIELMNSRVHGSEDALAELVCKKLSNQPNVRILIGGLGMGYTLAAALKHLASDARVVMAELVPAVISWNQSHLSHLAGHPLDDARVGLYEGDVGQCMRAEKGSFDAILLDVDNGPDGLTRKENDALYSPAGLGIALRSLRPKGVFGVWSVCPEPSFTKALKRAGFKVEEVRAPARGKHGGGRHMIWLGEKK